MNIEQIPADELVIMTDYWYRAFNAVGCNPMCHSCNKVIKVGHKFKLATVLKVYPDMEDSNNAGISIRCHDQEAVDLITKGIESESVISESTEAMLCEKCTIEDFQKNQLNELKRGAAAYKKKSGGCFRINGKIIH